MNGRKKIETIQKEFTDKFNYLTLIFLDDANKSIDVTRSLAEVRTRKGADISIVGYLKVNTLEKRFNDSFGLKVEVAYSKDGRIFHTNESVDKTLNELNVWCGENGCDKIEFKKRLTRNTILSVQELLFNAIREEYPDAVAKKINKDNFVDIHIPSVNEKRGTHLFFNTAKNDIKLGFYVRDEDFVNRVLKSAENVESYAQGLRISGNPSLADVEDAIKAAMTFLSEFPQATDAERGVAETFPSKTMKTRDIYLSDDGIDETAAKSKDYKQEEEEESQTEDDSEGIEDIETYREDEESEDDYGEEMTDEVDDDETTDEEEVEVDEMTISYEEVPVNQYCFINLDGVNLFGIEYDDAEVLGKHIAKVKKDGNWFCIDETGKLIFTDQYHEIKFSENEFLVKRNGLYGYVNLKGQVVAGIQYNEASNFSEGLAKVIVNGKAGYINSEGKEVIPCIYDDGGQFENGCGQVSYKGEDLLLNKKGDVIWKLDPDQYIVQPSSGLFYVLKDGKYGYIDLTGKIIIPFLFDEAYVFSEDVAVVTLNNRKAIINKSGKIVSETEYIDIDACKNGLLKVLNNKEKYGFIDVHGKEVIACKFEHAYSFDKGYAEVTWRGKTKIIDKAGQFVPIEEIDTYQDFSEGVFTIEINGRWFYVDAFGKRTNKQGFEEAKPFSGGYAKVKQGGLWGLIDTSGNEILPFQYNSIHDFGSGNYLVCYDVMLKREKFNGVVVANTHPISDYHNFEKLKSIIIQDKSQTRFADQQILKNEQLLSGLISANPYIYPYLPSAIRNKPTVMKMAVQSGFYHESLINTLNYSDEEELSRAVENNPLYFKAIPEQYRSKSVTLQAIANGGDDIDFEDIPSFLQNDFEFFIEILEYMEKNNFHNSMISSSVYSGYSQKYSNDREFIIKHQLLAYSSDSIQSDIDFISKYIEYHPEAISYEELVEFIPNIEEDYGFLKKWVSLNPNIYKSLKDEFREDVSILDEALKTGQKNFLTWDDLPNKIIYKDKKHKVPDIDLLVRINGQNDIIKDIPESLMSNEEFARKLLYSSIERLNVLYYAPDFLREDKAFVSSLLKENILAVVFAHKSLRADRDFMLPVIKKIPAIIKFCSEELISDKKFVVEAVRANGLVCRYLPEKILSDSNIYWAALHQNVQSFKFLPSGVKYDIAVQKYVAKNHGALLNDIPYDCKLSRQIQFQAIQNSPDYSFNVELVLYKSIADNITDDDLIQILSEDATQVVFLNEYYLNNDLNRLVRILSITTYPLKHRSCRDLLGYGGLASILRENPWVFKYLHVDEKRDSVLVKDLLSINGLLLQYCDEIQRANPDYVHLAVRQNVEACQYVSENFDWDTESSQVLAHDILSTDPKALKYFIEWDIARPISKIFSYLIHAFALDSEVIEFVPAHIIEYEMDNDGFSYGLNQDGTYIDNDAVLDSLKNICLSLENGKVPDDWTSFFENCATEFGDEEIVILNSAFINFPNEWTYNALKEHLGAHFDYEKYFTPVTILKCPNLYEFIPNNLKTNPAYAHALMKSEELWGFERKFELLHPSFRSDRKFLHSIAGLDIQYDSLLSFFDVEIVNEEDFLLIYLINNYSQYDQMSENIKNKRRVAVQYASCFADDGELALREKFMNDKDFLLEISKNNPYKKFTLNQGLCSDISLVKELIQYQPKVVVDLPDELKSNERIIELISINPEVCRYFENKYLFNPVVFDYIITHQRDSIRHFEWSYDLKDLLDGVIDHHLLPLVYNSLAPSIMEVIEGKNRRSIDKYIFDTSKQSETESNTLFYVNGTSVFTLGYDTNCYLGEDVAGVVSDEMLIDILKSDHDWYNYIWENSWYDVDNIYHKHGIGQPATHIQLPDGRILPIKLNYTPPGFKKDRYCFENSSEGDFVHISSSDEKAYGWNNWKKYTIEFEGGIFDVRDVEVKFDFDIVTGYSYRGVQFEEDENYLSTGKGFSSSLYFNNGTDLVLIEIADLREEIEQRKVNIDNISQIKKMAMNMYGSR